MLNKEGSTSKGDAKPQLLIPYYIGAEKEKLAYSRIALIAVRPETNNVDYESTIIKSASPHADVLYLANIPGAIVNKKAIVTCHYSSQLQFAVNGKDEMAKYPELIRGFEEKFNIKFEEAPIIGAYSAVIDYKLRKDGDELFATMVPDSDFLEMYGQTIKKIDDYFVLNYDIPAIITRHRDDTNIFVIAVGLKNENEKFSDIHHMIYDNMCRNKRTEIQGPESRENLPLEWYNRIRRTYHMSRSHIEAMFDLTDFVFKDEESRVTFSETPLGQRLIQEGVMTESQLLKRMSLLKENPLVYLIQPDGSRKLVDIVLEGKIPFRHSFIELSLEECCRIISRIDWERLIAMSND